MDNISAFDVIGPGMIGPSSSHTAGACSMALFAGRMFPESITEVTFTLYGSFAKTYMGHGTDKALLGGIMGFGTDDRRIKDAFNEAEKRGLKYRFEVDEHTDNVHPNTADICMKGTDGRMLTVRGESVGGGKIRITRIDGAEVDISGEYSTLTVVHCDRPGVAAHITKCLGDDGVNIATMKLYREAKGEKAYSIVESDEKISQGTIDRMRENNCIYNVMAVQV